MEKERMKINTFMGIAMSSTIGFVLAIFNVIMSGHFSWGMLGVSIILSIILGIALSFIIPARKLSERISENIISRFFKALVGALIINIVYTPIITAAMTFSMSYLANTRISAEIKIREEQIDKVSDSLKSLESTGLQNLRIENYNKQINELQAEVEGLNAGRPQPTKTIWKSIISSYILSTIICMITQPLWLKLAFRKYLNLR